MVPLSASIFPTTHPLRDRATDLLVSLSPPHRSLVVILSACPSLPRRSSREENNNKRIRVARGKFLGPREGEESESREQQMTFAPVKRTYNDRFFFSSEREEADLSNFERIFRASTSFPRKFLDDTISSSSFIQTEEGEGVFEKVFRMLFYYHPECIDSTSLSNVEKLVFLRNKRTTSGRYSARRKFLRRITSM